MNVAQRIIRCLRTTGTRYVFGIPGEEILDLLDALGESDLEFVPTRHEQGAAFMAATWGRLTGVPGVCLTTLGPGALNTTTGLAYSYLGQMPMILISGQKPAGFVKHGGFQKVDVVDSMQSITLLSRRLTKPGAVVSLVFNAIHTAVNFPFGPVHIELPEDVAKKEIPEGLADLDIFEVSTRVGAEAAYVSKVARLMNQAEAPLLIFGQHANVPEASAILRQFIEACGIPFASTQMGKGAVNEDHELYMGTTALSENDFIHRMASHSDLLILVGHNESEKPPLMACCHTQEVIHIHETAPIINETYFPSLALVGDIKTTIKALTVELNCAEYRKFEKYKTAFIRHEDKLRKTTNPMQIVEQVRQALPDDGIVALDNGLYKIWFARHYRARQPQTLLLDNALATWGRVYLRHLPRSWFTLNARF